MAFHNNLPFRRLLHLQRYIVWYKYLSLCYEIKGKSNILMSNSNYTWSYFCLFLRKYIAIPLFVSEQRFKYWLIRLLSVVFFAMLGVRVTDYMLLSNMYTKYLAIWSWLQTSIPNTLQSKALILHKLVFQIHCNLKLW